MKSGWVVICLILMMLIVGCRADDPDYVSQLEQASAETRALENANYIFIAETSNVVMQAEVNVAGRFKQSEQANEWFTETQFIGHSELESSDMRTRTQQRLIDGLYEQRIQYLEEDGSVSPEQDESWQSLPTEQAPAFPIAFESLLDLDLEETTIESVTIDETEEETVYIFAMNEAYNRAVLTAQKENLRYSIEAARAVDDDRSEDAEAQLSNVELHSLQYTYRIDRNGVLVGYELEIVMDQPTLSGGIKEVTLLQAISLTEYNSEVIHLDEERS